MDDDALLASGDHARLLAKYEPVIIGRCRAVLRGHAHADRSIDSQSMFAPSQRCLARPHLMATVRWRRLAAVIDRTLDAFWILIGLACTHSYGSTNKSSPCVARQ
jgi:hypothetical protein